jgi:translation initiation factor 1 (eIF-1/SUI1)
MAKKREAPGAGASSASPLKHNPFAALLGAPAETVEPARAAEPATREPRAEPVSKPEPAKPAAPARHEPQGKARGRVVLRRETKHRGGKAVIIVCGLPQVAGFDEAAIAALAKQLKQQLGCGGTVDGTGDQREIVLQGDRASQVAELLRAQGFRVDGVTR